MLTIVYSRDENLPLLAKFSYIKFIHCKVLQAQSDLFSFFFWKEVAGFNFYHQLKLILIPGIP